MHPIAGWRPGLAGPSPARKIRSAGNGPVKVIWQSVKIACQRTLLLLVVLLAVVCSRLLPGGQQRPSPDCCSWSSGCSRAVSRVLRYAAFAWARRHAGAARVAGRPRPVQHGQLLHAAARACCYPADVCCSRDRQQGHGLVPAAA
jgi:hypothetical protein